MMYTTSEQWVLVGLTGYGRGCAQKGNAGVYTRVAVYESWIASITGDEHKIPISSTSSKINIISPTNPLTTTVKPSPSSAKREMVFLSGLPLLLTMVFILF